MGYENRPWGSVALQRVSGLAKAITIAVAIAGLAQLVSLAFTPSQIDNARDFVERRIDEEAFTDAQLGGGLVQSVIGLATLTTAILSIVWLYRIAQNHRRLGRRTTFSPGFAIGGWFLPPLLYVLPSLILRENWKAAEPTSPPNDEGWRRSPEPWLVWVWFVLYSLAPLIVIISGAGPDFANGFGQDQIDLAQNLVDNETSTYITGALTVASAVAWIFVVRGLTGRHVRLTGEAR